MRTSNRSLVYSRLVVFSLVVSLLSVQTLLAGALPAKEVASAEITVSGPADSGEKAFVEVNGEKAFSGRTFFSNGTVSTTDTSSATIRIGRLGRIELAPASSLTLSFSEGQISGQLSKGTLSVANMDGVAVNITTPTDAVSNEGTASQFTVTAGGEKAGVAVASGTVRANGTTLSKQDDDDDDDDHWKAWVWVGIIGGAIATILIVRAVNDDDDASPVR